MTMGSSFRSSFSRAGTSTEYTRSTVFTSAAWTEIYTVPVSPRPTQADASAERTLALRMTLQLGPIQTTRMNFSRLDSLSFAYCTRTYAYDALLSSSCSRSSARPPDPVDVSCSLSERSDWVHAWAWHWQGRVQRFHGEHRIHSGRVRALRWQRRRQGGCV